MRLPVAASALAVALANLASPPGVSSSAARAASAAADLDSHPSTAELVVRADITTLDALATQLASLNIANRFLVGVARSAIDDALGFASADPAGWKARGIDPARAISASLSVDSVALLDRYDRLLRSDDWSQKRLGAQGFWNLRVVVPVVDATLAARFIRELPLPLSWNKRGTRGENAAGRVTVALRVASKQLVIDVVRPVFAPSLAPPSAADVSAALSQAMPAGSFGARKGAQAAAAVAGRGAIVWLRTSAIETLGRAIRREEHVAEVKGQPARRAQGPLVSNNECRDLSRTATEFFADVALRLEPRQGGLDVELVLGGDALAMAAAFPRAAQPATMVQSGVSAWASLWLDGIAGMRKLPRTRSMTSWPRALLLGRQCADHHVLGARLFAWPMLIGLFGDELAALGPRAKLAADSFAGGSIAIATWQADPLQMKAVIAGPLPAPALEATRGLLAKVFAYEKTRGDRTVWGRGRVRPFVSPGLVGATLGGAPGQRWFERAATSPRPSWLVGDELAAAHLDGKTAIAGLSAWEPRLTMLEGIDEVRVRVFLRRDQLVLAAAIERQ